MEAGDVGQRREVIVQQCSSFRLHVQRTVAQTSCVGLEDGEREVHLDIRHSLFTVGGIISTVGNPSKTTGKCPISWRYRYRGM